MQKLGWRKVYGAHRRHYYIIADGASYVESLCGDYIDQYNPRDYYNIHAIFNLCKRCQRKLKFISSWILLKGGDHGQLLRVH